MGARVIWTLAVFILLVVLVTALTNNWLTDKEVYTYSLLVAVLTNLFIMPTTREDTRRSKRR